MSVVGCLTPSLLVIEFPNFDIWFKIQFLSSNLGSMAHMHTFLTFAKKKKFDKSDLGKPSAIHLTLKQ